MQVVVAKHRDMVIGVYSDINLAKRRAKEALPYAYKRVVYLVFDIDDKKEILNDKAISKERG